MKETLEIPDYNPTVGLIYQWEDNFSITVNESGNQARIIANKAGLRSLAIQLLTLAQESVESGAHFHYDEHILSK